MKTDKRLNLSSSSFIFCFFFWFTFQLKCFSLTAGKQRDHKQLSLSLETFYFSCTRLIIPECKVSYVPSSILPDTSSFIIIYKFSPYTRLKSIWVITCWFHNQNTNEYKTTFYTLKWFLGLWADTVSIADSDDEDKQSEAHHHIREDDRRATISVRGSHWVAVLFTLHNCFYRESWSCCGLPTT